MVKFIVKDEVWDVFPDLKIDVVTIEGFNNQLSEEKEEFFADMLAEAAKEAQKFLTGDTFRFNPVVAEWREAYRQVKTKKGARSAIEALLKRADQGRTFNPINPLVDIYNSISLTYGVPVGAFDTHSIEGDFILGFAEGGEAFIPVGEDESDPALETELIYYDDLGAVSRSFNWRDGERTLVQPESKDVTFVIESLNDDQKERAQEAIADFAKRLQEYDEDVKIQTDYVDADRRNISL